MLKDFNIIATTTRGNETQMCHEMLYLLEVLGDTAPEASKSGIRGVIVAKTTIDPLLVIEKFHGILQEKPYEFRYALRIMPIQRVVRTDLDEIKRVALEFAQKIGEGETFRVTVEKRFTSLHSQEIIAAVATEIQRKVALERPDKVLLIEVLGGFTGISLVKPSDILSIQKEKML